VTPAPEKDHLREQIAALPKDLQEPAVRFIKSMNEAKTLQEIIAARKPLHTLILSLPDRDAARFAINGLTIGDNKVPMSEFLLERIVTVSASEVNTFIEEVKSAKDLRQLSLIERKMLLIDWNTYEYQGFAAAFEAKMPGIKWDQFIISARDALRSAPK
jgi:hypothetical protein